MTRPPFTPLVEGLPATVPFVGPEALERRAGRRFAARLGANENGFGPSPRAIEAMRSAVGDVWRYGDPESHDLIAALAARHAIAPERIVVGEGIDGLLGTAVRMFVSPGDAVVTSFGAYPTFAYHVAGHGGRLETVVYARDAEDWAALGARARTLGARMVYFANPDNPMGTHHPASAVAGLLELLPDDCLLVLDEAYSDYAPAGTAPGWGLEDPRLIRFRTFSKAYGLAGLRVGWVVADRAVAAGFDRVRNHFGVNRMAQAAALAALADEVHLAAVLGGTRAALDEIAAIAARHGLSGLPSAANFVAVDCGRDGAFSRRVVAALAARGIFVRMPGVAPLDRCIRISAGPGDEIAALDAALGPALAEAADAPAVA